MNGRTVTESTRERETFKYDPSLLTDIIYNSEGVALPNTRLRTSHDAVLTAIASLGASRLKTATSIVSLFDQKWHYMVAEASSTLSLIPGLKHDERDGEQLWMCGTAIPRVQSICEHTLVSQNPSDFEEVGELDDLPLSMIEDLETDRRHCMKPYCLPGSNGGRFYAAVPIRSKRGINIGVYCVIDTVPRTDWSPSKTKIMRDLSLTIMDYLELRRSKHEYRRSERMTRGLGSFVQGKGTATGWLEDQGSFLTGNKSALESNQQSIQRQTSEEALLSFGSPENPLVEPATGPRSSMSKPKRPDDQQTVEDIFSKAANIIRESIDIEGALFLDASMKSFGGLNALQNETESLSPEWISATSPPSEESGGTKPAESSTPEAAGGPCCSVLGFSTSHLSRIEGAEETPKHHGKVSERLLSALLARYPRGNIFNFDERGAVESSDSSDSSGPEDDTTMSPPNPIRKRNKKAWSRHMDGALIASMFPGARSVAFVPVWNAKRDRWHAGCFAFANTPTRIFTEEGELSYLRAFGMVAMSEIFRLEATLANKAKSDVLSSLSHELRSPLHGVILGVELLHDTLLDTFQGDVLHTVETCGRTLLDTMDHLLDFAKINNYTNCNKKQKRGLKNDKSRSIKDGMKNLYSDLRLDVLAEEVLESIFAGFTFQHLSVAQMARRDSLHVDRESYRRLDSIQAVEELGLDQVQLQPAQLHPGHVSIYLYVDPSCAWAFSFTPGAIRRILMNLFGNALKYTRNGTIKVSLTQEVSATPKSRDKHRIVKIVVKDTGKGISEDFLRNEVFKPFSQEDPLNPGTGLGLSLVKQIVSTLGGSTSIQSVVGVGTTVAVTLPLSPVATSSTTTAITEEDREFDAYVQQLHKLRIRLVGFKRSETEEHQKLTDFDHYALMENICCAWLGMQVIPESHSEEPNPDLVLCTEASMETLQPSNSPTVVICANALRAYQQTTASKHFVKPGVYEFISQPVGPRKLAKTLLLAFKRQLEAQSTSSIMSETLPTSVPEPCNISSAMISPSLALLSSESDIHPSPAIITEWPDALLIPIVPAVTELSLLQLPVKAGPTLESRTGTNSSGTSPKVASQSNESEFILVDDNPINVKILSSYMKKLNRKYKTAANGKEAVDTYYQDPRRYSCIFMDINMPIMDGFEATRQIRALERDQRLPPAAIFALSGLASAEAQLEAFSSGIDLFLSKPVSLKELSSILTARALL